MGTKYYILIIILIILISFLFLNYENFLSVDKKKIIIHFPYNFQLNVGGLVVLVYLAQIINEINNENIVSIYTPPEYVITSIDEGGLKFNNFTTNLNFDREKTIVIYAEQIKGNPLNAKYVVRWILAELSINSSKDIYKSWNNNDLIYYFNREQKFIDYPEKVGTIYKQLSLIYLNPYIINNNNIRNGYCHTFRKSHIHKNLIHIHPNDSFEISGGLSFTDTIKCFNQYKYFICYDPLSFLAIIAILCGCICIIYPLNDINKNDYLKSSPFWTYLEENNYDNFYGLAYGLNDIEYAENTLNKAENFIRTMISKINYTNINSFLNDLNNIQNQKNTNINNYF